MNRRSLLKTLAGVASGLILDPEKALWEPGRKTYFVPPVTRNEMLWDGIDFASGGEVTMGQLYIVGANGTLCDIGSCQYKSNSSFPGLSFTVDGKIPMSEVLTKYGKWAGADWKLDEKGDVTFLFKSQEPASMNYKKFWDSIQTDLIASTSV